MLRLLAALLFLFAIPGGAAAQQLSPEARISMITIAPGDAVYSAWGHSAFRVHDPAFDLDRQYNYGTFDFGDPLFVPKFAYGQLDYLLSVEDFWRAFTMYSRYEERSVIEQVLNLTPEQRDAVVAYLRHNALPENREYRYDFLYDNCSTRLRDVLEAVLEDDVRFHPDPRPLPTFRKMINPYVERTPWLHTGISLLLGARVDRRVSEREIVFLPDYLFEAFERAEVRGEEGWTALVASTDTLYAAPPLPAPGPMGPAAWFWLLFLAMAAVTAVQVLRRPLRGIRYVDAVLFLVAGFAGLLIFVMWFFTLHHVTAWNMHLLWAWPTHLVFAVVLLLRRQPAWLQKYARAAAIVGAVLVLGWAVWPQYLAPALLPVALLVTVRSAWYGWEASLRNAVRGREKPGVEAGVG
jgi:hypothetical protein